MNCGKCNPQQLGIDFSMAFQPIVAFNEKRTWGYETLVRGVNNEPASFILDQVNESKVHSFDQIIRSRSIRLAHSLQFDQILSINFLPNAVYKPENCIQSTLKVCDELGFDKKRIMFEVTEIEKITDHAHLKNIFTEYKKHQFLTAIDDFGAGYSGLNLLAEWQPDIIKLDMNLIRDIDQNKTKQLIVKSILDVCNGLNIKVISEGIETVGELSVMVDFGVDLFQGYYFAKPLFENLPVVPEACFTLHA
ncbi:MAG: EAL domain-containing protein [Methylophilus sp.]|uniref:EAL domain-containing protein n=1 Tax=Methylophilus sp. TaxID=29541 RepID=UPI002C8BCB33|nr:EAL domain-containing protein [Methylophilus sp.]HSH88144.1 EAL domain-containing protein [Methylophilus sp.]